MRHNFEIIATCSLLALALAGCDADSSSAIERYGIVELSLPKADPPLARAHGFFSPSVSRDAPNCGISRYTPSCEFWECDEELYTTPPAAAGFDAGAITISGARQELELSPDADGAYALESPLEEPLWEQDDALTVRVAGSREFPEMSATLSAPANTLEVSSPTDAELVLEKEQPFSFTWTPRDSGYVNIAIGTETLTTSGEPRLSAALFCHYPAPNGSATLSADVISALPKPPGLTRYTLDIFLFAGTEVGRNRAALSFQVTTVGYSGYATRE